MRAMNGAAVGIIGASGYAGMEATRILAAHPGVELRFVTSDRWVGEKVEKRLGIRGPVGKLAYVSNEEAVKHFAGCAAILLATPAEASLELVPRVLEAGARVIDLSGAFRLKDVTAYPKHYNLEHKAPLFLAEAVYGLPELFRAQLAKARLVSNPGCYPTAAALSLAPLLKSGFIEPDSIIIDAASGVTGAGRKATEAYSFCELEGDFRAYKVLKHQHTPEISQTLSTCAGAVVPVTFTPHLLPVKRGILSTGYATLKPGISAAQVKEAFVSAYGNEPFVSLADSPDDVGLKDVVGTNLCRIGVAAETSPNGKGRVVVLSAIDNLVKGAAGQAVQNLNLVMGWDETAGLAALWSRQP